MADLGYLLNQRERPANQGAASLGFLFGGGGDARTSQIYNQAAYRGAQMQDVLAQAKQRQQQAIARENLASNLRATEPELASLILSSGTGLNPDQVAKYREDTLKRRIQEKAFELAQGQDGHGADYNKLNPILAALHGEPAVASKIEGDTLINPLATPDQQNPITTALGQARIREQGSLAAEHGAQADRARKATATDATQIENTEDGPVLVNKRDATARPVTVDGKPVKGKPPATKSFNEPELLAAFGGAVDPTTGKPTVDPVKFGKFMQRKAKEPGKADAQIWSDMFEAEKADNTKAANTPSLADAFQGAQDAPGAAPAQPAPSAQATPAAPKVGDVRRGYRYKGGDPADRNSWEKVT